MSITVAVIIILGFMISYVIILDVYTALFKATGLTREKARFQTISVFTNSGFTTAESEIIASSPTRRLLAKCGMITGHVFSVLVVSMIVAIFGTVKVSGTIKDFVAPSIVFGSAILLLVFFKLPFISKPLERSLEKRALKNVLKREGDNIITILDNYGTSSIVEVYLYKMPQALFDKSLSELNLNANYSINLLIIKRKDKILEVTRSTILQEQDTIVLFGPIQNIKNLFLITEQNTEAETKVERTNEIQIIDNYGKDAMVEVLVNTVPSILSNKTIFQSDIKKKYSINIIMVKHRNLTQMVSKDTVVNQFDSLILYGPYQNIKDVFINGITETNDEIVNENQ